MNNKHKLKYLQSRLADCEQNAQKVQDEIPATLDILAKEALEKRLILLFDEIDQLNQKIEIEQNRLDNQSIQEEYNALIAILQPSENEWEKIQQAYRTTISHWSVRVKQDVNDVRSLIAELTKIAQGIFPYCALDEFIAHLFNEISDPVMIDELTQWRNRYRADLDWLQLHTQIQSAQDKRLENAQPAILVTITRSDEASTQAQDGETYYQLNAWLIEDIVTYQKQKTGYHPLVLPDSPDASPCVLDELLQKITHLLDHFLTRQRQHCRYCQNYPQFHIFLPLELMHLGVDVWPLSPVPRVPPEYLGQDYLVVLRCANRYDGNYRKAPSWYRLWKRHQDLLQESAQNVFVLGHDKDLDALRNTLNDAAKEERKFVGLQVTKAPVDTENLCYELLNSGLPIALWSRSNLARSSHMTQLQALLAVSYLETLPYSVKEKRYETLNSQNSPKRHIGHHLSLLWDDPYLIPPKSA